MSGPYERSAEVYDAFYGTIVDYKANAGKLRDLIRDRIEDARTVLEVACGTGAYAVWLNQWFDLTGLDISPQMLEVARRRLPDNSFVQGDMRQFDLEREFDAVLCLFSSIGHCTTREDMAAAVAAMARHAAPGGLVIVEPWITPEAWDDNRTLTVQTAEKEGLIVSRVVSSKRSDDLVSMTWGFVVGRPDGDVETFQERHIVGLFSHQEYLAAFTDAGLDVEHDGEGLIGRGLYIGTKSA